MAQSRARLSAHSLRSCQVDGDGEPLSARTVADNIQKYLIFAILSCIPDRQVQRTYIHNCIPDRQGQYIYINCIPTGRSVQHICRFQPNLPGECLSRRLPHERVGVHESMRCTIPLGGACACSAHCAS